MHRTIQYQNVSQKVRCAINFSINFDQFIVSQMPHKKVHFVIIFSISFYLGPSIEPDNEPPFSGEDRQVDSSSHEV